MQGLPFPHLSDLLGRRGFYLFNSLLQQCHTTTDNSVEMGTLFGIKCSRLILVLTWKKVWLSLAELKLNSWKWNFFSVWGAADRLPCRWQMIKTLKLLDWHITVAMLPLVLLNASLLLLRLRLMKGFDSLARDAICTTTKLEEKPSHSLCAFAFFPLEGGWGSFLSSFRTRWHGHHPEYPHWFLIFGTCYRLPQNVCTATYFFSSWILAKAWTAFCPLNMMDPEILEQCKMNWELSPSSLLPLG